jgi:hypothetical protein
MAVTCKLWKRTLHGVITGPSEDRHPSEPILRDATPSLVQPWADRCGDTKTQIPRPRYCSVCRTQGSGVTISYVFGKRYVQALCLLGYNSAQFDRVHHSPDGPSLTYSINHNYRKLDSPVQTAAGSIYFPSYCMEHCGSVRTCLLRGTMTRCCPNTIDRPCRIFGIHATIVHASDDIF